MGKRVHEALEFLYNEILAGRIPFLDAVLDKYDALWADHWHDRIAIVKRDISIELGKRALPGITVINTPLTHR